MPRDVNRPWSSVASSADGTKLIAAVNPGFLYTSSDAGITWTQRGVSVAWSAVAASADGTKLVAAVYGGQIATSTDSGMTWSSLHGPSGFWGSIASSANGVKLALANRSGQIHISHDSGATWTPRAVSAAWYSVASSADGSRLAAVVNGGQIYVSTDSGLNWTSRENNRAWRAVACSADATSFYAALANGQIWVATPPSITPATTTTPGTSGYLTGGQATAVKLIYVGNHQFLPRSHEGTVCAFRSDSLGRQQHSMANDFWQRGGLWVLCQALLLFSCLGGHLLKWQLVEFPCRHSGRRPVVSGRPGDECSRRPPPAEHLSVSSTIRGQQPGAGRYLPVHASPMYAGLFCASLGWALVWASGPALVAAFAAGFFSTPKPGGRSAGCEAGSLNTRCTSKECVDSSPGSTDGVGCTSASADPGGGVGLFALDARLGKLVLVAYT